MFSRSFGDCPLLTYFSGHLFLASCRSSYHGREGGTASSPGRPSTCCTSLTIDLPSADTSTEVRASKGALIPMRALSWPPRAQRQRTTSSCQLSWLRSWRLRPCSSLLAHALLARSLVRRSNRRQRAGARVELLPTARFFSPPLRPPSLLPDTTPKVCVRSSVL